MEPESISEPNPPAVSPLPALPQIRISDADRDAVVTQLNDATAEGRLTMDEFEQRTKLVYAAQFQSDLTPLTADLPVGQRPPAPTSVAMVPATEKKRRRWMVSIMGGIDRTGNWDPGDAVISLTLMGGQVLDLTKVVQTSVRINAFTMMGATEIIVPRGATVDLGGLILMGGSSDETTSDGESDMRVTVRSFGLMGGCEVRHLKPREEKKRQRRQLEE